jgi:hypothetical protein
LVSISGVNHSQIYLTNSRQTLVHAVLSSRGKVGEDERKISWDEVIKGGFCFLVRDVIQFEKVNLP